MMLALVVLAKNLNNAMVKNSQKHWDDIFAQRTEASLGWYESDISPSLSLLNQVPDWQTKAFFISGAGTSSLANHIAQHAKHLTINDISATALATLKTRLAQYQHIDYLNQDIAIPIKAEKLVDVWFDRAVLHFLTQPLQVASYVENLTQILKANGFVILAQFSKTGADQCAGLPVHRYNQEHLSKILGDDFELLDAFEHDDINPRGEPRAYIYTLFRKRF